jgi:cupin superfamily acireductone dioxygenase involved in methionine salvage
MKFLILFLMCVNLSASEYINTNNINTEEFLNEMQKVYHLKIHKTHKIDFILTGQTIFDYRNNRNNTYSCFKLNFW